MKLRICQNGSILIFSLWILMILTIFATQIGLRVRGRIQVIARVEANNKLRHVGQACVYKAIGLIRADLRKEGGQETAYGKFLKYNNSEKLSSVKLNDGSCEVVSEVSADPEELRNGVVDEESKLNLNFVDLTQLSRLIRFATGFDAEQSNFLAGALIDWREAGESQLKGFDSDNYYLNLKNPYQPKNSFYESVDEMMLVYGMNQKLFNQLKPYVTVYGNGQVNINTASFVVLKSLGLDERVIDKFLSVRKGLDAKEFTIDDYVFTKTYDISSEMKKFIELEDWEIKEIDILNEAGKIKANSVFYQIISKGRLSSESKEILIDSTYDSKADRLESYREKF